MAEYSSYFDSTNGLPQYTAQNEANRTADLAGIDSGYIIQNREELIISIAGTTVYLHTGAALINGRLYINDSNKEFTVNYCESGKTRLDRVVLKLDIANLNILSEIKSGEEGVSGVSPPELIRQGTIYEISLFQLEITDSSITAIDERDDPLVCGKVYTPEALKNEVSDTSEALQTAINDLDAFIQSGLNSKVDINSITAGSCKINQVDTRDDENLPSYYIDTIGAGQLCEFKKVSTLAGLITGGTYTQLVTYIPWRDITGGLPTQLAYCKEGVFRRAATSDSTWGAWSYNIDSSNILVTVYPVGSIYLSVSPINPATLFGGTWSQIQDRFLLSAGSTYSNGSTGGSANLHSHYHPVSLTTSTKSLTGSFLNVAVQSSGSDISATGVMTERNADGEVVGYATSSKSGDGTTYTDGFTLDASHNHSVSGNTGSTGSGDSQNMPPYFVVYMWRRTA